jgi:hypothetical protein
MDLGSRLTVIAMTDIHFSLARLLILNYGASSGLRTLDARQLSLATQLRRLELVDFFVSADAKLAEVADAQGISVINPLTS